MAKLNTKTVILGGAALLGLLVVGSRLVLSRDSASPLKLKAIAARNGPEH